MNLLPETHGALQLNTVSNPGPGNPLIIRPPPGSRWRILLIHFRYHAVGGIAGRDIVITPAPAIRHPVLAKSHIPTPAGFTTYFTFSIAPPDFSYHLGWPMAQAHDLCALPDLLFLNQGFYLSLQATNSMILDEFENIEIMYESWLAD